MGLFDQVADAVAGMVPPELGALRTAPRRWGIKLWFDDDECPREHYEAQVLGARHVPGATALGIEIGFHAEHPKDADNDDALAPILAAEAAWRPTLGPDATAGAFLGRDGWTRCSEAWVDPNLDEPELCFEIADTLAAYITTLEPLRHAG